MTITGHLQIWFSYNNSPIVVAVFGSYWLTFTPMKGSLIFLMSKLQSGVSTRSRLWLLGGLHENVGEFIYRLIGFPLLSKLICKPKLLKRTLGEFANAEPCAKAPGKSRPHAYTLEYSNAISNLSPCSSYACSHSEHTTRWSEII